MKPSLECKLLLKTNTYLPEIPSYWLDSTNFPTFGEDPRQVKAQREDSLDKVVDSTEIGNGPFTSACYSGDGQVLAVSNLDGIYLLGSYTRICFSAIPFASLRKELGSESPGALVCSDLCIFERNCFLGALFSGCLAFWDISPHGLTGYDCYVPRFIGSVSTEALFRQISEKQQQRSCSCLPSRYFSATDADSLERNHFTSVQGIRVVRWERGAEICGEECQKAVVIEFVLELQLSLPLLVQVKAVYGARVGEIGESSGGFCVIDSVSSVFPDGALGSISTKYVDSGGACKLISLAAFERRGSRLYLSFIVVGEVYMLLVFDELKTVVCLRTIPSYGKRHNKYLHSSRCQLNKAGDILVIQHSDRFTVYSLREATSPEDHSALGQTGHSSESEDLSDIDHESCQKYLALLGIESGSYAPRVGVKLLYSYSQVIQKEWVTSVSIFREREYYYHHNPHSLSQRYGPTTRLYPCGVLAVTTLSSNGQSFYYLMKTCSNSDSRSHIPNGPSTRCDHYCDDNTGSNMIIWKVDLTKLNGARRIVWQPGDSVCLAIQFAEKLKNTKLTYDDYFEMNNVDADALGQVEKGSVFGKIFLMEPRSSNDDMLLWSRLMIDFTAIHRNKEYIEKEDEFDLKDNVESGSDSDAAKKAYMEEYMSSVSGLSSGPSTSCPNQPTQRFKRLAPSPDGSPDGDVGRQLRTPSSKTIKQPTHPTPPVT